MKPRLFLKTACEFKLLNVLIVIVEDKQVCGKQTLDHTVVVKLFRTHQ